MAEKKSGELGKMNTAQECSDVQVIITKTWLTLTCSKGFTSYFLKTLPTICYLRAIHLKQNDIKSEIRG